MPNYIGYYHILIIYGKRPKVIKTLIGRAFREARLFVI